MCLTIRAFTSVRHYSRSRNTSVKKKRDPGSLNLYFRRGMANTKIKTVPLGSDKSYGGVGGRHSGKMFTSKKRIFVQRPEKKKVSTLSRSGERTFQTEETGLKQL